MPTINRHNSDGTVTTYTRRPRSPQRRAKDEARVEVRDGPAEAMDLDNYANVLLDFRDWCIARKINFRTGMMRAVEEYRRTEDEKRPVG